jgi:hypothetical protein
VVSISGHISQVVISVQACHPIIESGPISALVAVPKRFKGYVDSRAPEPPIEALIQQQQGDVPAAPADTEAAKPAGLSADLHQLMATSAHKDVTIKVCWERHPMWQLLFHFLH